MTDRKLRVFNDVAETGDCEKVRLYLEDEQPRQYIEITVRPDGTGVMVRSNGSSIVVMSEASNSISVCTEKARNSTILEESRRLAEVWAAMDKGSSLDIQRRGRSLRPVTTKLTSHGEAEDE